MKKRRVEKPVVVETTKQAAAGAKKPTDKEKENELSEEEKAKQKSKPVSSTAVAGTPWCVVWTRDKRVFFYNPSEKVSLWERPPILIGRADVDKLVKECPVSAAADSTSTTTTAKKKPGQENTPAAAAAAAEPPVKKNKYV